MLVQELDPMIEVSSFRNDMDSHKPYKDEAVAPLQILRQHCSHRLILLEFDGEIVGPANATNDSILLVASLFYVIQVTYYQLFLVLEHILYWNILVILPSRVHLVYLNFF